MSEQTIDELFDRLEESDFFLVLFSHILTHFYSRFVLYLLSLGSIINIASDEEFSSVFHGL